MEAEHYYQTGFNEGYLIAEHAPELGDQLGQINSSLPRIEGIQDGRRQFALDRFKDLSPSWTKERPKHREIDRDKSRDRDFGPEH